MNLTFFSNCICFLNYLTIRITLDKYEKESCIWRTLEQHNIINNPKNCNEIRQTMVTIITVTTITMVMVKRRKRREL